MRRNRFNDIYANDEEDIRVALDEAGVGPDDCYAIISEDEQMWSAEVLNNEDGELVFYVEPKISEEAVVSLLTRAGIDIQ